MHMQSGRPSHFLAYQQGLVWMASVILALHIVVAENRRAHQKGQDKPGKPPSMSRLTAAAVPEDRRGYPWLVKPLDTGRRVAGATLDAYALACACSVDVHTGYASFSEVCQ